MAELPVGHVTMISNDLPDVFWGHIFLLGIHKSKLALFGIALGLQLLPFSGCRSIPVENTEGTLSTSLPPRPPKPEQVRLDRSGQQRELPADALAAFIVLFLHHRSHDLTFLPQVFVAQFPRYNVNPVTVQVSLHDYTSKQLMLK